MPIIDPKVEEPARQMLGHAIRGELAELAAAIRAGDSERFRQVLGLFLVTAAYIAVDVSGRWPTDADLRKIARAVAECETAHRSRGRRPRLPVRCGTRLPASCRGARRRLGGGRRPGLDHRRHAVHIPPRGGKWWDYLDQIERAYEAAETTDLSVLPALQVRARMLEEVESGGREPG